MPLSSVVGAQSIVKPGVCTSSTRPASPFEGQMIYETDTDVLAIWNGSAWRYVAATTPTNGTVLQVVEGSVTALSSSTTTTYSDTGLSASITPKSSSSKVLVVVSQNMYSQGSTTGLNLRLVRDSTILNTIVDLCYGTASGVLFHGGMTYLDSPNTTSSTTYKTQFNRNTGSSTAFVQPNSNRSSITLMEIAG